MKQYKKMKNKLHIVKNNAQTISVDFYQTKFSLFSAYIM